MNFSVAVVSKYDTSAIKELILKSGLKIVRENPDFVICYGGDGTILYGERKYPKVPKLVIKLNSKRFRKYDYSPALLKSILKKIRSGDYSIIEEDKITAKVGGKVITALNEIQVRSKLPTRALRFSVKAGKASFKGLVGDGVIVATPFGSTGYYSTAGGRPFEKGIGLAFNNLFRCRRQSRVFPTGAKIKISVERGPAIIAYDNSRGLVSLDSGTVVIKAAKEKAMFVRI